MTTSHLCALVLVLSIVLLEAAPAKKLEDSILDGKSATHLEVESLPKAEFVKLQETANEEVASPKAVADTSTAEVLEKQEQPAAEEATDHHDTIPSKSASSNMNGLNSVAQSTILSTKKRSGRPMKTDVSLTKLVESDAEAKDDEVDHPDIMEPMSIAEDLQISPQAAAEYLLATGDFDNFYEAINQLVNAHMLTKEGAELYNAEVDQQLDMLTGLLVDTENAYMQALIDQQYEGGQDDQQWMDEPALPRLDGGRQRAFGGGVDSTTLDELRAMMNDYVNTNVNAPTDSKVELDSPELEVAAEPQPEPSALDGDKAEQEIQALAHAVMPAKNVASSKSVITEKAS